MNWIELFTSGLEFVAIVLIILLILSGAIFILVIWVKYFIYPILDWIESWGNK